MLLRIVFKPFQWYLHRSIYNCVSITHQYFPWPWRMTKNRFSWQCILSFYFLYVLNLLLYFIWETSLSKLQQKKSLRVEKRDFLYGSDSSNHKKIAYIRIWWYLQNHVNVFLPWIICNNVSYHYKNCFLTSTSNGVYYGNSPYIISAINI